MSWADLVAIAVQLLDDFVFVAQFSFFGKKPLTPQGALDDLGLACNVWR